MIITSIIGILSVLLAYFSRFTSLVYGLRISFLLIFFFLALRYMFGNDYNSYLNSFLEINEFSEYDFFETSNNLEIGWLILCRLFRPFGFFVMIAVLAALNCMVYYNFIVKYVPVKLYWFAIFIYVFNPSFMLTQLTAMRQSLAIMIFVFSLDYLFKKDAFRFFLCIALATLFHKSAIILFPVYFLSLVNGKINRFTVTIIISLFFSLFYFSNYFSSVLNEYGGLFFKLYFDAYSDFKPATIDSGLGLFYLIVLFLVIIYFERIQNRETALVFKISIISFFFIPLSMLIFFFGRVELYYSIGLIVVFPLVLNSIRYDKLKFIFSTIIVLITLYTYFQFFNSETYKKSFGTYQTIFFSDKFY